MAQMRASEGGFMNQFVIGIILIIIAGWFGSSAYNMWLTIPEFTEIQQTIMNAKCAFGFLFTLVAIVLQFREVKFIK
jgi:hypothetical protein